MGAVKRRTYDSSRRQAQAEESRRAVIDAALERFLADGYATTTMAAIAADAGVSVETVYKAFANKAGLLKAVYDVAVAGDHEPVPVRERPEVRRVLAQTDGQQLLRDFGAHVAAVSKRIGPLLAMLRSVAAADEGVQAVWDAVERERLAGMTGLAAALHERQLLRDAVTIEEARDVLWAYSAVDLWHLLVQARSWDTERFAAWLGDQLIAALL